MKTAFRRLVAVPVVRDVLRCSVVVLVGLAALSAGRAIAQPQAFIKFDGAPDNYVEIADPSTGDYSVNPGVGLTVSVWMRPDALHFDHTDGSDPNQQYVHWLGKGTGSDDNAQQEWTFRIYSQNEPLPCDACPRLNRVSFYVFNLARPPGMVCQNEGIGSYFQYPINDPDPLVAGEWIHVVGVVDDKEGVKTTSIYKNGNFIRCDRYQATGATNCQRLPDQAAGQCPRPITPTHGTAPVRIGHRDRLSYLNGAIAQVRIWNRALDAGEVATVYAGGDPAPDALLMGQYVLDETGDDTTAHDTSANPAGPHDGTVLGTTWMWGP
jgi:hypothetical protein